MLEYSIINMELSNMNVQFPSMIEQDGLHDQGQAHDQTHDQAHDQTHDQTHDQAHDQTHDQGDEYDVEEEDEYEYDEDEIEEAEDYRDKWRYTFYTVLVFIILGNPYLYSFLNTNLGKLLNKSSKSDGNSPGIIGFVVCAIIFTFTVRWMMDLDL